MISEPNVDSIEGPTKRQKFGNEYDSEYGYADDNEMTLLGNIYYCTLLLSL
jgi:hypothetical protein